MIHVSYTDLRKRLAHYMDRANDDRDAILITRQGHEPVVMIAQSEWEGMRETLYLMSSRANAERLNRSVEQANSVAGMIEVEWDEQAQTYKPL